MPIEAWAQPADRPAADVSAVMRGAARSDSRMGGAARADLRVDPNKPEYYISDGVKVGSTSLLARTVPVYLCTLITSATASRWGPPHC